jgi:zinc protease
MRRIVLASALFMGCAAHATSGLLDNNLPTETMSSKGDLGFDRLTFPAKEIPLPSGLRVAYEKASTRGMVGVFLALDVGSTSDPAGKEGLAHFVEHLVFRQRLHDVELTAQLQRLGAIYNAETTPDRTAFYAMAPARALPALLGIVAGVLEDPLQSVEAGAALVELDVVRNELALRNETGVYGQLREWMQALLMQPGHPYRRPTGGTSESLAHLSLEDARQFARGQYHPTSATLLVVGDGDGHELSELLHKTLPASLLGDAAHPVTREAEPVPLLDATIPAQGPQPPRHQAAVAMPELWLGYLMPGKFSRNAGNTRMISSQATEDRLRQYLDDVEDVVGVSVVPLHDRLSTTLAIQVVLSSDKHRDQITKLVRDYVAGMWRPLNLNFARTLATAIGPVPVKVGSGYVLIQPTPEMFLELKGDQLLRMEYQGVAETLNGLESWSARALERAEYLQVLGHPGALLWAVKQTTTPNWPALAEFAGQFLAPERARVMYLDPLPVDRRPRGGATGVADRRITDDRKAAVDYGEAFFASAPEELAGTRQVRLENGLTAVLVKRSGFPGVTALLGFGGGSAAGEPAGVVELVRRVEAQAGTAMPLNGLHAQSFEGPTFTGELVRGGRRNLSRALYLLAQRIVDTDQTDWEQLLDGPDRARSFTFRVTPEQKADHLVRRSLYGDHPLARPPRGPEGQQIRGEHMEGWLRRMRSPQNALLVVVGDVDLDESERLARGWFGSWKGDPKATRPTLPPVPAPERIAGAVDRAPTVVDRAGDSQAQLILACRLPDGPQQARHELLASVLASYLNTIVRFQAGAAYSIDTHLDLVGGGASDLVISMELAPRRVPEALAAVRSLWNRLGDEGFDPGAVSQSRWGLAAGYNLGYQTGSEVAMVMLQAWSLGWPLESVSRYRDDLRASTPADLRTAFATCRETTSAVVMGERTVLDRVLAGGR